MFERPTDRIWTATGWLLITLGLLATAVALIIAADVYDDGMRRSGLEAPRNTRVQR